MPELTEYLEEAPGALRVQRRRRQSVDISGKASWRRWVLSWKKWGGRRGGACTMTQRRGWAGCFLSLGQPRAEGGRGGLRWDKWRERHCR